MSYRLPDWRYEEIKLEVAKILIKCNITRLPINGFEIANSDFKLRGPGDYLGDEQSGFGAFEYASFTPWGDDKAS